MTDAADALKLMALDEEDLSIISAHVQDAVMKVKDLDYLAGERRFVVVMNRFLWEKADDKAAGGYERRRSVLVFERVLAARTSHIRRDRPDAVLHLLAVEYEPAAPPAGAVTLVFAGGGAVRLEVECVEARLADLGPAWETRSRPEHELADGSEAGGT